MAPARSVSGPGGRRSTVEARCRGCAAFVDARGQSWPYACDGYSRRFVRRGIRCKDNRRAGQRAPVNGRGGQAEVAMCGVRCLLALEVATLGIALGNGLGTGLGRVRDRMPRRGRLRDRKQQHEPQQPCEMARGAGAEAKGAKGGHGEDPHLSDCGSLARRTTAVIARACCASVRGFLLRRNARSMA